MRREKLRERTFSFNDEGNRFHAFAKFTLVAAPNKGRSVSPPLGRTLFWTGSFRIYGSSLTTSAGENRLKINIWLPDVSLSSHIDKTSQMFAEWGNGAIQML
ncbi:hypothetical protein CDAR_20571 [Caerostris darwini]|uniref:Uncharacterized protein n=1 Tax=Caerostris darwini TaxID=1538125 RepID=A0AAV4QGD4_9ARAC|nr:hypothetical protein CDAR_20571 [Caerostris darwini]